MTGLPRLNQALLTDPAFAAPSGVAIPTASALSLPERVVQFGSGRFLRGFVEDFIHRANVEGRFSGRVVVVQSTGGERSRALEEQDGLYTLCVQGLSGGSPVESYTLNSAVSRALSAENQWDEVLACARNPEIACVVSNTTETGIRLDEEDRLDLIPPRSFPGKLTAFLYERAAAFNFAPESGFVILPCELIEDNGDRLREVVLALAQRWDLGHRFSDWLVRHNQFCNTLVDRIVTGTPSEDALRGHTGRLGYEDHLFTIAEPYRLWAVQGGPGIQARLPFLRGEGTIVADSVTPYRELKVRILNGAHTAVTPLALLAGKDTVLEVMQDPLLSSWLRDAVFEEILPSLNQPPEAARAFADAVLDRFSNPFLEHRLLNITLQSTSKVRHRIIPSILSYHAKTGRLPERLLLGFAAYLLFMRGSVEEDGSSIGSRNGEAYVIQDERVSYFTQLWSGVDPADAAAVRQLVARVTADQRLWGTDLSCISSLVGRVSGHVTHLAVSGREVLVIPDLIRDLGRAATHPSAARN